MLLSSANRAFFLAACGGDDGSDDVGDRVPNRGREYVKANRIGADEEGKCQDNAQSVEDRHPEYENRDRQPS